MIHQQTTKFLAEFFISLCVFVIKLCASLWNNSKQYEERT